MRNLFSGEKHDSHPGISRPLSPFPYSSSPPAGCAAAAPRPSAATTPRPPFARYDPNLPFSPLKFDLYILSYIRPPPWDRIMDGAWNTVLGWRICPSVAVWCGVSGIGTGMWAVGFLKMRADWIKEWVSVCLLLCYLLWTVAFNWAHCSWEVAIFFCFSPLQVCFHKRKVGAWLLLDPNAWRVFFLDAFVQFIWDLNLIIFGCGGIPPRNVLLRVYDLASFGKWWFFEWSAVLLWSWVFAIEFCGFLGKFG